MESQKPMAPQPKATTAAAKVKKEEKISNVRGIRNAFIVILACAAVAVCIFLFGMGARGNFASRNIDGAMKRCKTQKGSVASVVYNTLVKYKEMEANDTLSKEQKLTTLRNEVEEATALEMPGLSQNLPIIATLTTLGTLDGLLGTVMGMIKSFQALAASGSPDSTELSTGISEALVNTAFGIMTGAFAVISYNFFTNKIDNLTYAIDEIGFSIVATYAATHK